MAQRQNLEPIDVEPAYEGDVEYNNVFGRVRIGGGGRRVTIEGGDKLKNYIRRELGVARKTLKNNRIIDSLTNPRKYLVKANEDLLKISDTASKRFKQVYALSIERGFKDEEAQKEALKAAKDYYNSQMKLHEEEFPADIKKSLQKAL